MKILALSGSPTATSINRALLEYAASTLDGVEVELLSVRDFPAPFYSGDREEAEGQPATMRDLHARLAGADAFLLASPEYNGGMPAMLKNTIDWISRVGRDAFACPVAMLSASPGGRGGRNNVENLLRVMPHWGATVVGSFSLGRFHQAFDRDAGAPVDPADRAAIAALMASLVAAAAARGDAPDAAR